MTPEETGRIGVELAEMRGEIRTGFAQLSGRLDLALQRTGQTEEDIRDLGRRLDALEKGETEPQRRDAARLASLEAARWPLPSLAAVASLGSLGVALYALTAR